MIEIDDLRKRVSAAKALIFDCDGTLVDTIDLYCRSWEAGFAESGFTMPHAWYLQRAGMSEYSLLDAFESYANVELDRERIVSDMRAAFRAGISQLAEISEVAKIARCKSGALPLAVASGGPREIVEECLIATQLRDLFSVLVTIDDVGQAKPAPDLFLEAAKRLGVKPDECLVFEDSAQGLQAARCAGMPAIDIAMLRRR